MRHRVRTPASVAILQCSPALWRFVRAWRFADAGAPSGGSADALAVWSATVLTRGARDIVLGVEQHTWLALVCELGAETTFAGRWKQALELAFDDMRLPLTDQVRGAGVPRMHRAEEGRIEAALSSAAFVCGTELHFQPDLRIVQRRLNEFPHDHPPDYVPAVAVRRLLGRPRDRSRI